MRKIFTLLATLLVAIAANAQLISFTEAYAKGTLDGKEFGDPNGFLLKLTDNGTKDGAATPKLEIDQNDCYFGTLDTKVQFNYRLKTGGKSSSTNAMTVIIPTDGVLVIYARTGSNKATDRNIKVTQNKETLIDKILLESEAVSESYTTEGGEEKTRNIYPVIAVPVEKGTVSIEYPVNAINIYGLQLGTEDDGEEEYTMSTTLDPTYSDYVIDQAYFEAESIAKALGLADVDALGSLIRTNQAVYLELADGTLTNEGFSDANQPWMTAEPAVSAYGAEGSCWFAGIGMEAKEEGGPLAVNVWVGQMPGYFKNIYTETKLSANFYIVNGDKKVKFTFNVDVAAAEQPTEHKLSELNIIKEYTLPLEFVKGKSYEGKTYSTTLEGVYDALGCTADDIDSKASSLVYTQVVKESTEKCVIGDESYPIYVVDDVLQLPEEAAPGAWFGIYYNKDVEADADGNVEVAVANAPKAWNSGNNTFWAQNITLANGEFSINSGQFPNVLEMDKTYEAPLYLIYGDKAVKINVVAKLYVPESVPFAEMTSAGSQDVEVTADIDNNHATKPFTVDVEKVYEALGCTADDIDDIFAFASEGEVSDNHTEGGGGYFFDKDGYICSYSASAAAFIALTSIADGEFKVGQYPHTFENITEDETVTFPFLYMYGDKYYTINLKYTVKAPAQKEEGFEYNLKATEVINRTIIPGENWLYDQTTELDHEYIASIIGTTDYTLYGEKYTEEDGWKWTKNTNCSDGDSKGAGFWYKKNAYEQEGGNSYVSADGWGDNSFGFQLSTSGVISWFQYPGLCNVGESYSANIYLVNEETGDYIKYIINVVYAEEDTPEATVVGTEKSSILVSDDSYDETSGAFRFAIPTDAAYEALGLTDELLESSATVSVPKSSMVYQAVELEESATINANGYIVDEESEDLAMAITIAMVEGKPVLIVDDMGYFAEENKTATVRFAIEYNGNRYNYELTLSNNAEAVGINGISAAKAKANGKYLENGKIVIVRNGVKYNVAGAIVK